MASPTPPRASQSPSPAALLPAQKSALRKYGGINALIATCNRGDRFHLLEDESVPRGNLDNFIHPVFTALSLAEDSTYAQAMRLASHLLTHDSLLTFFVPLLYGRQLTTRVDGAERTFLSDPLANVSNEQQQIYLDGVREALHCLGHSLNINFVTPVHRVYARTLRSSASPTHTARCCPRFQKTWSPRIEIADYFKDYYENEYRDASRCAQFRHDFLFATTLVHEIIHAFGVFQRGDLYEPYIRANDPNTEWGWAWENFMFGCIINPQSRAQPGTHLLMRKIWADDQAAETAGGKEYYDVSMAWIAQWFREKTWDIVAERGPTAILPPTAHFKIQSSTKIGSWIVSSDLLDVRNDLQILHSEWRAQDESLAHNLAINPHVSSPRALPSPPTSAGRIPRLIWRFQTTERLQESNVPIPVREPQRVITCAGCRHYLPNMGQRRNSSTLQRTQGPGELLFTDQGISECAWVCRRKPPCHTPTQSRFSTFYKNAPNNFNSKPLSNPSKRSHGGDTEAERPCKRKRTPISHS